MLSPRLYARTIPAVAVGLGLCHAAVLGGLNTPVAFTRALLAVGVLSPMMLKQRSTRVGSIVIRPQGLLLPLLVALGLGPVLALAAGRVLLPNHPEQATALLFLSIFPGSALAPLWARSLGASRSTTVALTLLSWAIATVVGLPLFASPLAPGASFVAFRDLALLGVMPLAVGTVGRWALDSNFDPEQYAASVEPVRRTIMHASLATLLFTSVASRDVAAMLEGFGAALPAVMAVSLLYLGLFLGSGAALLVFRRKVSRAAASATWLVATTHQTVLAMALLPLAVAPPALASALRVPLAGLVIEVVVGTAVLALQGSRWLTRNRSEASVQQGCPSIVPE